MLRFSRTAFVAAAVAGAALTAGPALAAAPAPVGVDVLTYGALGPAGPNIPVGNTLAAGGHATFLTAGLVGTSCAVSTIKATVTANPPAPGTALTQLNVQTFNDCTSTIPGVTSVVSVTADNLPYELEFSDTAGLPVRVLPGPKGPIQVTIVEIYQGTTTACVWQPVAGLYNGNYTNSGNAIVFKQQELGLISGPVAACAGSIQYFSATYQPLEDTSIAGAPAVFVN